MSHFLMLEKKQPSHDQLPPKQKEQQIFQPVAQKGINIHIPTTMDSIPVSLGGWNLSVKPAATQLLVRTHCQGSAEMGESWDCSGCACSPNFWIVWRLFLLPSPWSWDPSSQKNLLFSKRTAHPRTEFSWISIRKYLTFFDYLSFWKCCTKKGQLLQWHRLSPTGVILLIFNP